MNTLTSRTPARSAWHDMRWLAALLVALAGAWAGSAWAQPASGHAAGRIFHGSPEQIARAIDHMLDGLAASDSQRGQVKQIAQAAATDLRPQRAATRELRERAMQAFLAPNVDAAAAESVRQQIQVQHDQSSRRIMQAMIEISRVLSPEQRAKMGERWKQQASQREERQQRQERQERQR